MYSFKTAREGLLPIYCRYTYPHVLYIRSTQLVKTVHTYSHLPCINYLHYMHKKHFNYLHYMHTKHFKYLHIGYLPLRPLSQGFFFFALAMSSPIFFWRPHSSHIAGTRFDFVKIVYPRCVGCCLPIEPLSHCH